MEANKLNELKSIAADLHSRTYNCAQCVLCACHELCGLDEKTALSVASGFGGGMGSGEVCGCISGGIMAIGMAKPFLDCNNPEEKKQVMSRSRAFIKAYNDKYGAIRCAELKAKGISCPELIAYGVEVAATMIEE